MIDVTKIQGLCLKYTQWIFFLFHGEASINYEKVNWLIVFTYEKPKPVAF